MNQDAPTTKIDNDWYFALFLQDDYRVSPRLTLNLGLRYEIRPPIYDNGGTLVGFSLEKRAYVVGGILAEPCRNPRSQLYLIGSGLLMMACGLVLSRSSPPARVDSPPPDDSAAFI